MLGADTFVSAILRVATTVAILAAVYFFIVKPILHTTESVTHNISGSFNVNRAIRTANHAVHQSGVHTQRQVRIQVHRAVHGTANLKVLPKQARRVIRCIQHANGNVKRIEACNR